MEIGRCDMIHRREVALQRDFLGLAFPRRRRMTRPVMKPKNGFLARIARWITNRSPYLHKKYPHIPIKNASRQTQNIDRVDFPVPHSTPG